MRWNIPVLCAAVMLAAFSAPSHAAEVRIGDFEFSCKTSDGATVKPKFGDIDGAFFTDMPAQRDQCIETVERKIAGCEMNTVFASNTEAERYPGCEPIFAEQGKACAAFYREEMAKCDIGSAEAGTSGESEAETSGETISRECPEEWSDEWSCEGPMVDGKRHGDWVLRFADGDVWKGPYVDGKRHGDWVLRFADGDVWKGPYVDGKKHGNWVERYANGNSDEGPYVDGKRHGKFIGRGSDGSSTEQTFVNDEATIMIIRRPGADEDCIIHNIAANTTEFC